MTIGMDHGNVSVENVTKEPQVAGGLRFDWEVIAFCTWLVLGGYSDAWAHNHVPSLETFFTPWHGVLYTGLLVTIIFLVGTYIRNRRRGYSWNKALPHGYGLSLIGVAFFALGGVGDLIWHTLFGIELNIDGAPALFPGIKVDLRCELDNTSLVGNNVCRWHCWLFAQFIARSARGT